jgi:hypothetical protein
MGWPAWSTRGDWWLQRRTMSRAALTEYLTSMIWGGLAGLLGESPAIPSKSPASKPAAASSGSGDAATEAGGKENGPDQPLRLVAGLDRES